MTRTCARVVACYVGDDKYGVDTRGQVGDRSATILCTQAHPQAHPQAHTNTALRTLRVARAEIGFFPDCWEHNMLTMVEDFENDCLARIEKKGGTPSVAVGSQPGVGYAMVHDEQHFPAATYFLMGVGFGVIAARVACTCILIRPSEWND